MNTTQIRSEEKTRYLINTLSRTGAEDYENHIINAIWNRLSKKIRPITQQYVTNPYDDRLHYFIALYLPLISTGIEFYDRDIPKSEYEANRKSLIAPTVHDKLNELFLNENYKACRMSIYNTEIRDGKEVKHFLPFEELEARIDETVNEINARISKLSYKLSNHEIQDDWKLLYPGEYFKDKAFIKASDNTIFKTQREINKLLFNVDYALQKNGYKLPTFENNSFFDDHIVCYPRLTLKKPGREAIVQSDCRNQLLSGGKVIEEYRPTGLYEHSPETKKIIFAKDEDYLGNDGYKFIGIFALDESRTEDEYTVWVYKKIADECPIIRR